MTKANRVRVLSVLGTRPEAIKLGPLVRALSAADDFESSVLSTGQHREMLDQVLDLFEISPDVDLAILQAGQTLAEMGAAVLKGVSNVLRDTTPSLVLVQGDTTSAMAAALAAYYAGIPVVHVEAGLRSRDLANPFPEEMNRRLITKLASLHLAPTLESRRNLLAEGVEAIDICVTGNTVIDALTQTVAASQPKLDPLIAELQDDERRVVLVTAHRRESWGEGMAMIGASLAELARKYPAVLFLLPVHRNPVVRAVLLPRIEGMINVVVCEPLDYASFCWAMKRSYLILTDSGGVQEEAPSLGKPVLVMRSTTERPEAVESGTVRLVGTDDRVIVREVSNLLDNEEAYDAMARATNPYGDGHATRRSLHALRYFIGSADAPLDFAAQAAPPRDSSTPLLRAPSHRANGPSVS